MSSKSNNRLTERERYRLTNEVVKASLERDSKFTHWDSAARYFTAVCGFEVTKANVIGALRMADLDRDAVVEQAKPAPMTMIFDRMKDVEDRMADLEAKMTEVLDLLGETSKSTG